MKKTAIRKYAAQHEMSVEQTEFVVSSRAMTEEGMELLPPKAIKKSLRRMDFPNMPRQRQAFRLEQAGVSSRGVELMLLQRAVSQMDSMMMRSFSGQTAGLPPPTVARTPARGPGVAPPPAAGLAPANWVEMGPGEVGGRTRAVVIHPNTPTRLWIGAAGGGVWHSLDAGTSWAPVDDFMTNLAVTSLVIDPTDPDTIYAGTGEGFGNLDSLRGAGLFVTRDGTNWTQIAATANPNFFRVNRLGMSSDGQVLMAATNTGLFRSVDPDRQVWTRVSTFQAGDLKFHPTDPKKAVVGSLDSGQIMRTVDGGASWTLATHSGFWSGRIEVCYAAADPDTVYASINMDNGEIWRSKTGGRTFTKRKSRNPNNVPANYLGDQGWYDNVIWAGDPTNADLVIVGGIDLWRSTDGGNKLTDISTWWDSNSIHADHHAIVSHPDYDGTTNRTVYFGNDGGIYRADDVATVGNEPVPPKVNGWTNLNNSYGVTQFYGGAINETTGVMVCGAQDNGTLAFHPGVGGGTWRQIFGGDGGFCAADPTDSQVFYGEYVRLNIHRNTDGATTDDTAGDRYISGQFWNPFAVPNARWDWKPDPFRIPDAQNGDALFIAPFALDPSAPETILAGGNSLWRTTDAKAPNTHSSGPRWHSVKSSGNGRISAVTIDPSNSDHVWVGHTSGEVWRSLDATATSPNWTRHSNSGPQPLTAPRYCHQIAISPHDPDTIVVAFGGFSTGNVWRSDDQGATWANVGAGLPEAPVRAVTFHPFEPRWLYIGTEVGVLGSEDLGASWSVSNEGPANVSVDDLIWQGQTLICITHGRGVFSINLSRPGM